MFSSEVQPRPHPDPLSSRCSYLVTNLMGADLNNIVKFQKLSDEHVQFLIYQLLRGLKVTLLRGRRAHVHTCTRLGRVSSVWIICATVQP